MGKIFNGLSSEIMVAMKNGERVKVTALRNLKKQLGDWKTSKEGAKIVNDNGGEIPEANEIAVLKKYVKELNSDAELYKTQGREDIANDYLLEASFLTPYLPKEASEEDIRKVVEEWLSDKSEFTKKEMGICIKHVKEVLPSADGRMVSQIVMNYL